MKACTKLVAKRRMVKHRKNVNGFKACKGYKQWDGDDMEGALHELSQQCARNTKDAMVVDKCKSIRHVAKE